MITCPKCNKEFEDGVNFCIDCGSKIEQPLFCHNCGERIESFSGFCHNCGTSLSVEEPIKTKSIKKFKFVLPKKFFAIGGAAVALVLVVCIVLSFVFTAHEPKQNYALYVKDGEMYYTDFSNEEPFEITSRLWETDDDEDYLSDFELWYLGAMTTLTDDGKKLFYFDRFDEDFDGGTLFYRYVNKPDEEAVKIDSDIYNYFVSKSGELVTYLKDDNGELYQHNLEDKEKIAENVTNFYVSGDGSKIVYLNTDDSLYLKRNSKDKEKLDSDVDRIAYITEKAVYYIKDNTLYKRADGEDKKKIDTDVSAVLSVTDSGEVYYLKTPENQITLLDYIEDDMKEEDAAIVKPDSPEYPSYFDFEDYEEYSNACDAIYDAYLIELEKYNDKCDRDELRDDLETTELTGYTNTLFYYNGSSKKKIADSVSKYYAGTDDKAILVYTQYEALQDNYRVKLSEIDSAYDFEDEFEEAMEESAKTYVAVKDTSTLIDKEILISSVKIAPNAKSVYFLADYEDNHGDLYTAEISGSKLKKPVLYDSDVYYSYIDFHTNGKLTYFKDVKDGTGDLYIDKKAIDYSVEVSSAKYIPDLNEAVYIVDWDEDEQIGTLKAFRDNKAEKVSDDVHDFVFENSGDILYLYDYSTKYRTGELFHSKNGKSEKIDTDVSAIIPLY